MSNCKNCMHVQTCKFVDKNKEFTKHMYPMFEYPEWNNLEEIFYGNAASCKFFVANEMKVNDLLKKIETAKYQMDWIHNYVRNAKDASYTVAKLLEITEKYKTELAK